jgi:hypothetical protein
MKLTYHYGDQQVTLNDLTIYYFYEPLTLDLVKPDPIPCLNDPEFEEWEYVFPKFANWYELSYWSHQNLTLFSDLKNKLYLNSDVFKIPTNLTGVLTLTDL